MKSTRLGADDFRVRLMLDAYGSIEAARDAYRAARAKLHPNCVLMVTPKGRIVEAHSAYVFYKGSPDAPFVLP